MKVDIPDIKACRTCGFDARLECADVQREGPATAIYICTECKEHSSYLI